MEAGVGCYRTSGTNHIGFVVNWSMLPLGEDLYDMIVTELFYLHYMKWRLHLRLISMRQLRNLEDSVIVGSCMAGCSRTCSDIIAQLPSAILLSRQITLLPAALLLRDTVQLCNKCRGGCNKAKGHYDVHRHKKLAWWLSQTCVLPSDEQPSIDLWLIGAWPTVGSGVKYTLIAQGDTEEGLTLEKIAGAVNSNEA